MKQFLKIILNLVFLFLMIIPSNSEEKKENINEHSLNFYSGMFDYSDDGQKAILFGFQHENENLVRESFLGTISPITGFMITENNAAYGARFFSGDLTTYRSRLSEGGGSNTRSGWLFHMSASRGTPDTADGKAQEENHPFFFVGVDTGSHFAYNGRTQNVEVSGSGLKLHTSGQMFYMSGSNVLSLVHTSTGSFKSFYARTGSFSRLEDTYATKVSVGHPNYPLSITGSGQEMRIGDVDNNDLNVALYAFGSEVVGVSDAQVDISGDLGIDSKLFHNGDTDTHIKFGTNQIDFHAGDSSYDKMRITSTGVVINEDSQDYDFRVETNNSTNAFQVNGGTDNVTVNVNSPGTDYAPFTVAGSPSSNDFGTIFVTANTGVSQDDTVGYTPSASIAIQAGNNSIFHIETHYNIGSSPDQFIGIGKAHSTARGADSFGLTVDDNNRVRMPNQICFLAFNSSTDSNISTGRPTPIKYLGFFKLIIPTVLSTILIISLCDSPTERPPSA